MRARAVWSIVVVSALASCTRATVAQSPTVPILRIERLDAGGSKASPSPLVEIRAGHVQAVVPKTWDAAPLPETRYPQQGFIASPRIPDWERRTGTVNGMEAFWIDEANAGIPSDYYYLVARGPALAFLGARGCHPAKERVFADHPPDLTGAKFSPSDYVASGSGTCRTTSGGSVRWAYAVAAPGFGPVRGIGIPTSGLYVVVAAVSGGRSRDLLDEIVNGARFGNASVSQIERAAITPR